MSKRDADGADDNGSLCPASLVGKAAIIRQVIMRPAIPRPTPLRIGSGAGRSAARALTRLEKTLFPQPRRTHLLKATGVFLHNLARCE